MIAWRLTPWLALVAVGGVACGGRDDEERTKEWDRVGMHLFGEATYGSAWVSCNSADCARANVHAYFSEKGWETFEAPQGVYFATGDSLVVDDEIYYASAGRLWRWSRADGWRIPWPELASRNVSGVHGLARDDIWVVTGGDLLHWDGSGWSTEDGLSTERRCADDPSRAGCTCVEDASCGEGLACRRAEYEVDSICCPESEPLSSCRRQNYTTVLLDVFEESPTSVYVSAPGAVAHWDGSVWTAADAGMWQLWVGEKVFGTRGRYGVSSVSKDAFVPLSEQFWRGVGSVEYPLPPGIGHEDVVGIDGPNEKVWSIWGFADLGEYDTLYAYSGATYFGGSTSGDIDSPVDFWMRGLTATSWGTAVVSQEAWEGGALKEWVGGAWHRRTLYDLGPLLEEFDPLQRGRSPSWIGVQPVELRLSPFE